MRELMARASLSAKQLGQHPTRDDRPGENDSIKSWSHKVFYTSRDFFVSKLGGQYRI